ncbi:hypothetical protein PIB30_034963 [Stylosanthes scabra]|uniref:Uncharacterized protein n=1 Tax=Stylosanthes scabra TaxID=79078 RepID=A0ABU6YDC3_9FABA|nr:hypothetical protein [Stylosanthes scabra]
MNEKGTRRTQRWRYGSQAEAAQENRKRNRHGLIRSGKATGWKLVLEQVSLSCDGGGTGSEKNEINCSKASTLMRN